MDKRHFIGIFLVLALAGGLVHADSPADHASCAQQGYTLLYANQTLVASNYFSVVFNGMNFSQGGDGQHPALYKIVKTANDSGQYVYDINASVCAFSSRPEDGNWAYIKADLVPSPMAPCAYPSFLALNTGSNAYGMAVGNWIVRYEEIFGTINNIEGSNIAIVDSQGQLVNQGKIAAAQPYNYATAGLGPNYTVTLPDGQRLDVQACYVGHASYDNIRFPYGTDTAILRAWLNGQPVIPTVAPQPHPCDNSNFTTLNVGGVMPVGQWSIRLADITVATGASNVHPAVFDILDANSNVVTQGQAGPGDNGGGIYTPGINYKTTLPGGQVLTVQVCMTNPSFPLNAKSATLRAWLDGQPAQQIANPTATANPAPSAIAPVAPSVPATQPAPTAPEPAPIAPANNIASSTSSTTPQASPSPTGQQDNAVLISNQPPLPPTQATGWTFKLTDAHGSLPDDSIVQTSYNLSGGQNGQTLLVAKNSGLVTLYLPNSAQPPNAEGKVGFVYDDPATPAPDGIAVVDLATAQGGAPSTPVLIRLQAVGGVAGTVTYGDGRPTSDATVEIDCPGGERENTTSSSTGAFSFENVHVGTCLLSAIESEGNQTAQMSVNVSTGQLAQASLQYAAPVSASQSGWSVLDGAIILLVVFGLAAALMIGGKKPKEKMGGGVEGSHAGKGKKPESAAAKAVASLPHPPTLPDKRQTDLLATLSSSEKDIVVFVQKTAPGAVQASKIRKALLIPKTTFTRTLQALERKQFLELKKDGSRMHVKLHEFYRKN